MPLEAKAEKQANGVKEGIQECDDETDRTEKDLGGEGLTARTAARDGRVHLGHHEGQGGCRSASGRAVETRSEGKVRRDDSLHQVAGCRDGSR